MAEKLGISESKFRQLKLSGTGTHQPPSVHETISRKLVDVWGLRPWEFWGEGSIETLTDLPVSRIWFAAWKSTEEEFLKLEEGLKANPGSSIWSYLTAMRCKLAGSRWAWLQNFRIEHADQKVGASAENFTPSEQIDDYLGEIKANRALDEQPNFIKMVSYLKAAHAAPHYNWSTAGQIRQRLGLNNVARFCWDMPIIQRPRKKISIPIEYLFSGPGHR